MVPSVIPLITITTRTIHCDSAFSGHNTCSNISIIAQVCPAAQAATKALCETAAPGFFAARTVDIDGISTIPKAAQGFKVVEGIGLTLDLPGNCRVLHALLGRSQRGSYRGGLCKMPRPMLPMHEDHDDGGIEKDDHLLRFKVYETKKWSMI